MSTARIAIALAAAAGLAWALKALAIWNAGGLDRSALEGPLFALGLLLVVGAFAALDAALAGGGPFRRVVAAIGGALAGLAWVIVIESLVGGLAPDSWGWVQEEVGLWTAAVLAFLLALLLLHRRATSAHRP